MSMKDRFQLYSDHLNLKTTQQQKPENVPHVKYCLTCSSMVLRCLETFSCSAAKESSEYSGLATTYCWALARFILLLLPARLLLPLYVALQYINHIKFGSCLAFEHHLSKNTDSKQQRSRPSNTDRAMSVFGLICQAGFELRNRLTTEACFEF